MGWYWDGMGKVLVAAVKKVGANWSVEMAEAGAALYGVQLTRRLGYERVVLECDALNVVHAIKTKEEGVAPIFLFYEDIHGISAHFELFICIHVQRAGNTAAHLVARWEVDVGSERVCMDVFPQSLNTLAELDLT